MGSAEAINQETVLELFKPHTSFAKIMLDAWAIIDCRGKIVKSNPLFSQLVGESSKKIRKSKSLNELINFFIEDKRIRVEDFLNYQKTTRIDEVGAATNHRIDLTLIVGIYPFHDSRGTHQGSFLLLRDVTDDKALHDKYKTTKTDSITDQLTNLYTRRFFENYLATQERNARNQAQKPPPMCVTMVDIDHFKKVNDVYGHQAGDAVLKLMGELISKAIRKSDIACRYGGEEFIILLPRTSIKGAAQAANNLRLQVQSKKFFFQNQHIPITISSGVAEFDFQEELPKLTIERADKALYQCKKDGRNQVQIHEGDETITKFDDIEMPERDPDDDGYERIDVKKAHLEYNIRPIVRFISRQEFIGELFSLLV